MTEYRMAKHVMSKEELAIATDCLMRAKFLKGHNSVLSGIEYPELRCLPMTTKELPHAEALEDHPFAYKFSTARVHFGYDGYASVKGTVFDAIVCGDLIMQMKEVKL